MPRILLGLLFALCFAVPALAATRYVDGNLASDCTSGNYSIASRNCSGADGNAYKTLVVGVAAMSAGDTLYIRAGTYTDHIWDFPVCTSTSRCVISQYQSETVSVIPTSLTANVPASAAGPQYDVFRFYLARYVTINGLTISAASTTGTLNNVIRLQLGAANITLTNNTIISRSGANAAGNCIAMHDGTNSGHVIVGNKIGPCGQPGNNQWHGIYVRGSDHTMARNYIHSIGGGHGIHFQDSTSSTNRNVVEYNTVYSTGSTGILIGSGDDNIARFNIVELAALEISGAAGIRCRHYGSTRCVIYNNTIINTGGVGVSAIDANYGLSIYDGVSHTVKNNIVCGDGTNADAVYNGSTGSTITTNQTGTACSSLLFKSATDFSLLASSPALGTGTSTITASGYSSTITNNISLSCNGPCDIGSLNSPLFASCSVEDGDDTKVRVTFTSNRTIQGSAAANWAVVVAGSGVTESAVTEVTSTRIDITVPAVTNGQTVTVAYTAPASNPLRNTINIGGELDSAGTKNAAVRTFTAQSCTNNVGDAPVGITYEQLTHLIGEWYATVATLTGLYECPSEGADCTLPPYSRIALRLTMECNGGDCDSKSVTARYSLNSGSYTAIPATAGADAIAYSACPSMENGAVVASGEVDGVVRSDGTAITVDLAEDEDVDMVFCLGLFGASLTDTYDIRLYDAAGTALDTYTETPRITVGYNSLYVLPQ